MAHAHPLRLIQRVCKRREVAGTEVRTLQQIVERVHAAERRELRLVVEGAHECEKGSAQPRARHHHAGQTCPCCLLQYQPGPLGEGALLFYV